MIIENKNKLELLLKKEIIAHSKPSRVFAGHLPMVYNTEHDEIPVHLDDKRWGEFSTYTFELGAKLVRHSLDSGLESKLMVVVDDDIELTFLNNNIRKLDDQNWKRKRRKKILKKSRLPKSYEAILNKYALNYNHLETQLKKGVESVLISEKRLKTEARKLKLNAPNKCSLAYKGLLFSNGSRYFDQNEHFHIGFLPGQCNSNICEGIIDGDFNLIASFVFFPHIEDMGGLIPIDIGYKKSSKHQPSSSDNWFKNNQVTLIKTTYNK